MNKVKLKTKNQNTIKMIILCIRSRWHKSPYISLLLFFSAVYMYKSICIFVWTYLHTPLIPLLIQFDCVCFITFQQQNHIYKPYLDVLSCYTVLNLVIFASQLFFLFRENTWFCKNATFICKHNRYWVGA